VLQTENANMLHNNIFNKESLPIKNPAASWRGINCRC